MDGGLDSEILNVRERKKERKMDGQTDGWKGGRKKRKKRVRGREIKLTSAWYFNPFSTTST